jgi:two-component system response regulator HydG/two-component system response regulator AtoC
LIGGSSKIAAIRQHLVQIAGFSTHVLITGETGTGKELAAEMVHHHSPRSKQPFISVNCAAIPDGLFENELFGHEKGAFTGADIKRSGLLASANGGTIFLDEIGEMPLGSQSKILRLLENKEIQRLGSARSFPIDVRIVAATNQHLEEQVKQGKFRCDLYYRLNIARVHIPPLRERREDIPGLVAHFLHVFNAQMGREVVGLEPDVHDCLMEYQWPGNVRELKNLLEATLLTIRSSMVGFKDLPEDYQTKFTRLRVAPFQERERLVSALASANWNISQAAKQLHWSRMTLYRKLTKYGLDRPP